MAKMFPETLVGIAVKSSAERELYTQFQQQLNDHYHVLHSVAWLGICRSDGDPEDGEADFVIVHAELGILLIEVKGGIVECDPASGNWFTTRRDTDEKIRITNPARQVMRNKKALENKIKELPNWTGPLPVFGHAVAFPDCVMEAGNLGPEITPEIMVTHDGMSNLDEWVRKCMVYWRGDSRRLLPDDLVSQVIDALRSSIYTRPPRLGEKIGVEAKHILRLTESQFSVLDGLKRKRKLAIMGCAGSGKTVLASMKAKQLAREGFNTLFTCTNPELAIHLQAITKDLPRLMVADFRSLCEFYAQKVPGHTNKPEWNEDHPGFDDEIMPGAVGMAIASDGQIPLFDAIIVDEGQDFRQNWWIALEQLLADEEDGILYIFYDNNQVLYRHGGAIPLELSHYTLSTNCRNTVKIHDALSEFYESDVEVQCRGPMGRPPQLWPYNEGIDNLRSTLTAVLARLIYERKIKTEEIVVLCAGDNSLKLLNEVGHPGHFRLTRERDARNPHIFYTSVRLFKGLESPVVVILVSSHDENTDENLYVGLSRAGHHVVVITAAAVAGELAERIKVQVEKD